ATISKTGVEKVFSDSNIGRHSLSNFLDIATDDLTEARKLVHETDPSREKSVTSVLRDFRRNRVHANDRVSLPNERSVKFGHALEDFFLLGADHDAIGLQEVLDRGTFLQKLRIADDIERLLRLRRNPVGDHSMRSDRHGRLIHD